MPRGFTRGTEYEGIPEVVSPGQSIPKKMPRGIANQGSGSSSDISTVASVGSQVWCLTDDGITNWTAGSQITVLDLNTLNTNMHGLAYSFPGDTADDNDWTVQFMMPDNYDPTQPIYATLVVVQDS